MYRIGEFSILTGVSVKTLRYYDYINLLKPSKIDQYTNYRYYTNEELTKFQKIEYLKKLGFTLEEIKANLANLTPHCIEQKKEELKAKRDLIMTQIAELDLLKESLIQNKSKVLSKR